MSELAAQATLPLPQCMELLSLAYIAAVAAQAGFSCERAATDWASRDGTIHGPGDRRPRLDFQAKAHAVTAPEAGEAFPFDLKIKNYNDLRNSDVICPQLLFVVVVPPSPAEWLNVSDAVMLMRYCGYWHSLRGAPETRNTATQRIAISRANRLDAAALTTLMRRAAQEEWP